MSYEDHLAAASQLEPALEAALLARLENGTMELPVLPEVAALVLTETSRADWSATTVVELLRRDPAMAANLMRLSNSVAFRGASSVVSLQQAVARLGASSVRQLAVVIACETRVFQVPGFEPEVRHLFRHSLTAAFAAREIARTRRANVEEAFLAGLLHDVGWPLVMQALLDLAKQHGASVERHVAIAAAKRHHAPVARRLAVQWKFPERLSCALEAHHAQTWAGPWAETAATLALADAVARVSEPGSGAPDAVRAHPALQVLNLYPDAVDALLALAPRWWVEAGAP